jgi:tripartite-type tricarboxylate transporter receptor subunit TctC
MPQRFATWLTVTATTLFAAAFAAAQDYPQKPIRLVQGFGPGGNADTVARLVGAAMAAGLGQQVIVEPRTGAGGNVASDHVAKSAPDGYTLILLTGGHAVSAGLYKSLPFHPLDDFSMISIATYLPFVISVRPDHPARDLAGLIRLAREKPGAVKFTSVGVGTTQHLIGELLAASAGVEMLHVPYRGGAAPLQGVLSGDVDALIDTATFTTAQLQAGKVRALAVTPRERLATMPGVPPVADTIPGFDVRSWTGIAGPRGLPAPIVERLNAEVRRALAQPELRKRLEDLGNDVRASAPEEMRSYVADEIARWTKVIREARVPQQ